MKQKPKRPLLNPSVNSPRKKAPVKRKKACDLPVSSAPDLTVRYDATLRHLRKCIAEHEAEATNFTRGATEAQTQRYQATLRRVLEALIQHANEVAKLEPQLKRPN
jgi:hypothetical protein